MAKAQSSKGTKFRIKQNCFFNSLPLCPCAYLLFILAIPAVLISGCGYTIRSGIGSSGITTINIATFENKTFEHGLEVALSEVLIREFIVDGTLSVADSSRADVRLSGEILEYVLEPYTYGAYETDVEQYRIQVRTSVSLKDAITGEIVWEEKLMEGDATYYLTGSLAQTEEEALELALYELAKKVVSRTIKAW